MCHLFFQYKKNEGWLSWKELAKGSGTSSNSLRRYALDTRHERITDFSRKVAAAVEKSWGFEAVSGAFGVAGFVCTAPWWKLLVFWTSTRIVLGFPIASFMYSFILYNHVILIQFACQHKSPTNLLWNEQDLWQPFPPYGCQSCLICFLLHHIISGSSIIVNMSSSHSNITWAMNFWGTDGCRTLYFRWKCQWPFAQQLRWNRSWYLDQCWGLDAAVDAASFVFPFKNEAAALGKVGVLLSVLFGFPLNFLLLRNEEPCLTTFLKSTEHWGRGNEYLYYIYISSHLNWASLQQRRCTCVILRQRMATCCSQKNSLVTQKGFLHGVQNLGVAKIL